MSAQKTLPEQVAELNTQLNAKTAEVADLNAKLTTANTEKANAESAKATAESALSAEKAEHAKTKDSLGKAEAKSNTYADGLKAAGVKIEGDVTAETVKAAINARAEARATEIAAAAGHKEPVPAEKKGEAKGGNTEEKPKTGYARLVAAIEKQFGGKDQ